ncbi:MAG: cytochrome c oxidase subunit [Burkholderiales bacterium]|jgi:cytochrome c oxidase subunit 2
MKPSILATVLLLSAMPALAEVAQSALHPAGVQASHILDLWRLTLAICTFVFAAVLAAFLYAIWRAPRSGAGTPPDLSSLIRPEPVLRRNVIRAVALSTALLLLLIVADFFTDRALAKMPLQDALHIELTGHQWWWEARYGDPQPSRMFTTANEFHIPVGKPVIITLKSSDVIHTFWVPNLHGKKDMIPGRTSTIQLRADKPGVYRGQCAEFCGFEHALMAFNVIADTAEQYEAWAEQQRQPAPEPADELQKHGRQVFLTTTCVMCHTIQGTTANATFGPDLTHIASRQTLAAGSLPNTAQHLAGWIVDPQKFKPGANMPANPLPPDDMQALLAYMGALK